MRTFVVGALVVLAAGSAIGQVPARPGPGGAGGGRAQLEAQFRREFAQAVRRRVGLTNDQMTRLAPIASRFSDERLRLQMEERNARMSIQRAIRDTTAAPPAEMSRLLQRLVDIQKQRVQLLENEQRELAAFMTPHQRARYMAMQEQLRRQVEQRRRQGGGAPRRRPPPR